MRVGDLLIRLDNRLLPPLANGLTRLVRGPVRRRCLTGTALLSATAVVVSVGVAADRRSGEAPAGEVIRVGVVDGQSVPDYLRASRGELATMARGPASAASGSETYALVSLAAYFGPERLTGVLRPAAVVQVYARAEVSGMRTRVVRISARRMPRDVITGMLAAARRRDRERVGYLQLSRALTGQGPAERRLRAAYDDAVRAAAMQATAYRAGCSCVYAAVVRATPAGLGRIARRREVRAVDPAPEVRRLDRAEFRPPLPEHESGPPALPPGSPGSAEPGTPRRR